MRVLQRPDRPGPADYVRLLHLTLDGLARAASEEDPQWIRLRTGLTTLANRISEQSSAQEIEGAVNAAVDLVGKLGSSAAQRALTQVSELKSVLQDMSGTVSMLSESRTTAVRQLTAIERQLEEANALTEIDLLKPRLAECVELVRQETVRLQKEAAGQAMPGNEPSAAKAAPANAARRGGSLDLATGLPGREAAERLIVEKAGAGRRCTLALFVPERLGFLTKRHGREAEDEILLHVAQHLTRQVPSGTWLYRWSGPSLLAIRPGAENEANEQHAWYQIAGRSVEKTIQNERRSALIRVTLACLVTFSDLANSALGIFKEMDEFVTSNTADL